ncbi:MAG: Gfo/Idh/MocA family oxidoreductase [Gloeobacteraceae cyanobacterium ES-bin-144]|nr:Gfo/Idh/MocA family oxidoreductase [Verrucomicrobiales bacterium]
MQTHSRRNIIRLGAAASLSSVFRLSAAEVSDKKLGIALLGLGNYATTRLAPAIKNARNARLAGIVTGSPNKIPVWQKEHGIPDANVYNYSNLDTIAANKDIDIVYIVTPTGLHAEYAIRALNAGKHVICEKPMAPTVEDCTRMIEAAQKNKRTLQIGYRLHWDPYHLRLIEAMKEKEFGAWTSIDTAHGGNMKDFTDYHAWRITKQLGIAGALYDLGVYAVQGQLYSAQELPIRVTARNWTDRKDIFTEVPEHWEWELEFKDGRRAKGFSSYGKKANHLHIETIKGRLGIDSAYGYSGQQGFTPDGPMNILPVPQQQLQIEGQVDTILSGKPSLVPGEMGRRDIRVIRGIMAAAESGKPHEFGDFN